MPTEKCKQAVRDAEADAYVDIRLWLDYGTAPEAPPVVMTPYWRERLAQRARLYREVSRQP
jgi:hypothetical protein